MAACAWNLNKWLKRAFLSGRFNLEVHNSPSDFYARMEAPDSLDFKNEKNGFIQSAKNDFLRADHLLLRVTQ
jgi:hypothetical protein